MPFPYFFKVLVFAVFQLIFFAYINFKSLLKDILCGTVLLEVDVLLEGQFCRYVTILPGKGSKTF